MWNSRKTLLKKPMVRIFFADWSWRTLGSSRVSVHLLASWSCAQPTGEVLTDRAHYFLSVNILFSSSQGLVWWGHRQLFFTHNSGGREYSKIQTNNSCHQLLSNRSSDCVEAILVINSYSMHHININLVKTFMLILLFSAEKHFKGEHNRQSTWRAVKVG